MYIQIAPRVKVYVTYADFEFIQQHWKHTFKASELAPEQQDQAKRLADKAIFVRKKLDTDTQYALNRRIRIVRDVKK
tara:strand:- start:418 stop:648 length:231 start_codon:yes stop_codon:yes gene_type:complete